MFSSSQFGFCFHQEEGARSTASGEVPEHFPLSSMSTTRILLIGTENEAEDGQLLFPHAWLESNQGKSAAVNSSQTVNVDRSNGWSSDARIASALPPPDTEEQKEIFDNAGAANRQDGLVPPEALFPETLASETLPSATLASEALSGLQKLQSALEHSGHQVVVWPCGLAFSILGRDLLDFEMVVVQDGARLEEAVSLCRVLKAATTQSGACLLAALSKSSTERETTPVARRVRALQEAGADGILDGDAPLHEIASVVRTIAQLARTRRELEATHEQLRLQLQTDDLTNLLNRRFFFQAAHREYERSQRTNTPLSCLMIDLDHFRRLSENFGFECCDAALRCVANVLRSVARDGDIVARFGEGKFVFLLPETGLNQATQVGEMLQRAVREHAFVWRGQTLPITVSVGEATRPIRKEKAPLHGADNAPNAMSNAAGNNGHASASSPDILPPEVLPLSEALETRASFSTRDEIAALLEEADAALFVSKRGVRSSSLLDTPPLSLANLGRRGDRTPPDSQPQSS
ncbi:MAG TPA: GGDEF domain-containing protein [Abditibacteriaceae bacterium]|nr:GGDEF domain-containing protein [Abditibacteriaceae bacterium]